ncbi:hypothetical protein BJ742DRAFT_815968 [Cladochytrium replicatum]|nr:hypothetical protein BJ742DRAFT_815968 [Cladochytrium replicatum]
MADHIQRDEEESSPSSPLLGGFTATWPFIRRPSRRLVVFLLAGLAATTILAFGLIIFAAVPHAPVRDVSEGISSDAFAQGQGFCQSISVSKSEKPKIRSRNPRFDVVSSETTPRPKDVLLRNAVLIDGDGSIQPNVDVFMSAGVIVDIGSGLAPTGEYEEVNLEGRYVTPGIVDQHSHHGIGKWPGLHGDDDVNEMTNPVTSSVRALDGYDTQDPAIAASNSGGVTSSLVIPGSGNVVGGEGYVFKHRAPLSNSAEEMLINYGMDPKDGKQWRWIKMACGENPKSLYGFSSYPATRMGFGAILRQTFHDAKKLKLEQEDWCSRAGAVENAHGKNAHRYIHERLPEDPNLEIIVGLLRGDVLLQNHCYTPKDMEVMIRASHEFGFKITTFHHAQGAWQLKERLAKENVSVAMFVSFWGYKAEAYHASVYAGKRLAEAGVAVAYKSDAPAVTQQNLIYEAQRAHHWGLPAHLAIQSVTKVPAERLGQGFRIGRILRGYDADVVVWDRHPLELGAHPLRVFVDGHTTFSLPLTLPKPEKAPATVEEMTAISTADVSGGVCKQGDVNSKVAYSKVAIVGIGRLIADKANDLVDAELVIKDGIVECFGRRGACNTQKATVYDLNGGWIIPGAVVGGSFLGLEELAAESSTLERPLAFDPRKGGPRASDGLNFDSKMMTTIFSAGVTQSFSIPRPVSAVIGQSALISTGAEDQYNGILLDVGALHLGVGNDFKGDDITGSVAGQIDLFRTLFLEQVPKYSSRPDDSDSPFLRVLRGDIPLVVSVHNSDHILKVLALKKQIDRAISKVAGRSVSIHLTIFGGAEAWFVAKNIAEAGATVVLAPPRCSPVSWEIRKCLRPGQGTPTSVEILKSANVTVAVTSVGFLNSEAFRDTFWEAGWLRSDALTDISEREAIGWVTWDAAKALGGKRAMDIGIGRIAIGKRASVVGYNGSPLAFGAVPQLIVDGAGNVVCWPQQP